MSENDIFRIFLRFSSSSFNPHDSAGDSGMALPMAVSDTHIVLQYFESSFI